MIRKILFGLMVFPITSFAQDTIQAVKASTKNYNTELGINTTFFLKQVFNLSNNTFATLPYEITYKHIKRDKAFRAGIGININNSTVSSSTSSTSQNQSTGGPDVVAPTTNNSFNTFYRVGWEWRYVLGSRLLVYWGVDIAGQFGTSKSQSSQVFNNLPSNYSYTKTTDATTTMVYGGGPVAGIQYLLTKRISFFTEIPVYFQYLSQKQYTENYRNQKSGSSSNYFSSEDTKTQITEGAKLSVTLPVTLYLALKF